MHHNNRRAALILTLALLGALATAAYADITSGARSSVQNAYNAQNAALDRKDADGALAHTASDYVGTDLQGGRFTLQTRRDGFPAMFTLVKSMQTHTRILAFTLQPAGNAADVKAIERQDITIRNAQTGLEQHGTMDQTIQDHWVLSGQGWLLQTRTQLDCQRIQ